MAVTVTRSPREINSVNNPLVYSISSSNYFQPQFRFVTDVYYSGSTAGSDRLTRLFHAPNIYGTANVDVSTVLGDYISYDYDWKTDITASVEGSKKFTLKFGEEYGTSISSSRTIYTGSTDHSLNLLNASITYPEYYPTPEALARIENGTDYTLDTEDFTASYEGNVQRPTYENFYYEQYFATASADTGSSWAYFGNKCLSNDPAKLRGALNNKYISELVQQGRVTSTTVAASVYGVKPLRHTDYETVSFMHGRPEGGSFHRNSNTVNYLGAPSYRRMQIYKNQSLVTPLSIFEYFNDGMITGSTVYGNSIQYQVGVGIANSPSASAAISSSDQWDYMKVQIGSIAGTLDGSLIQYYFNEDVDPTTIKDVNGRYLLTDINGGAPSSQPNALTGIGADYNCGKGKVRFAFIGKLGTWEYYTIYKPFLLIDSITRETYDEQFVKTQEQQYAYNISNRGKKQYYTTVAKTYSITTEALDRPTSNFLQDMFNSSEVYIADGSRFYPINILNVESEIVTDTYRQRNTRYTIEYRYSQNLEPR